VGALIHSPLNKKKEIGETMGEHIGSTIQTLRKRRKLTQMDLAVKCGIRENRVSWIETERVKPTQDELRSIAKALNIPVKKIIEISETDW